MKELRDLVGSVHHLAVFHTAAHHESFTHAAEELCVTQPAVSRSIRALEAALGVSVFRRGHRSVTLTEEGRLLYHSVSAGFERMLETARQLHRRTRESHVTVITSSAFANYWMLPRLSDFRRRLRDIGLRVQISDRYPDLSEEPAALAIWWGDGSWPGCDSLLLASEEVFPIASPAFLKAWKGKSDPESLAGERLIHLEEPFISALTWSGWFAAMDVEYHDDGQGLWCNDYTATMHAAMAGEGIALGWRHVVDGLLEKGLLVRVGDRAARRERQGCYLVWSSSRAAFPASLGRQVVVYRDCIGRVSPCNRSPSDDGLKARPGSGRPVRGAGMERAGAPAFRPPRRPASARSTRTPPRSRARSARSRSRSR